MVNREILSGVMGCLLAIAPAVSNQQWDNPANRYQQVYQQYDAARCPLNGDIVHFVYLARDRGKLREHSLLSHPAIAGAQIMYAWAELEPEQGRYVFDAIEDDLAYLASHDKRLFVQLQDATFNPVTKAVPEYLLSPGFDGGAVTQLDEAGKVEGWVAKRWNRSVQERFALLLKQLGDRFDGRIQGLNLQETAIGVSAEQDASFSPDHYANAIQRNMQAAKVAFSQSVVMQYANFMPGEWLPWEDHGYLRSIYQFGEANGIALGAPDLLMQRKGQLNHALAMMHEGNYSVPLGIAVQDGNYIGETNSNKVVTERKNRVPVLHAFADDFLRVSYMFWSDQAPYLEQDFLPCLAE